MYMKRRRKGGTAALTVLGERVQKGKEKGRNVQEQMEKGTEKRRPKERGKAKQPLYNPPDAQRKGPPRGDGEPSGHRRKCGVGGEGLPHRPTATVSAKILVRTAHAQDGAWTHNA